MKKEAYSMKNKLRIIYIIIILNIVFWTSPILCQEKVILDISRMVELTISNNLDFKKASYQLGNSELEIKQLEAENLLSQSTIINKQKEVNILQQQYNFQNQKDQLIIQAVDSYFNLVLSKRDIKRKEKSIDLERSLLKEIEAQVKAGYRIELDLLQEGNKYYDALFSYEKAKLDYEQLLIKIKNDLGLPDDADMSVIDMSIPNFPEIDWNISQQKARENSLILKSKGIEVDLMYQKLENAKIEQASQLEIAKLTNNLEIAKLEQIITEQNLDYQVLTLWQNHKQNENSILLSKQSLIQMEENELIIKRQVQAGLRTEDELLSASIGVLDAEYRLISSVKQCYQSYLELQKIMGILDERGLLK